MDTLLITPAQKRVQELTTQGPDHVQEWVREQLGAEPQWRELALCVETDPEVFFPEKGGSTQPARRTCALCDVWSECLAWSLATGQTHGIWGGVAEKERRPLIKQLHPWGAGRPATRRRRNRRAA